MGALLRLAACGSLFVTAAACLAQTVGDAAPEIEAAGWENNEGEVSLERFKDRIIVLVYWSRTDGTSVELFALFNELHEKYYKRGVVLIAVTRESQEKAQSTVKGRQAKFIVGYGFNPERRWRFSASPYYYIVDIHGKVAVAREHAGDDLEGRIKEVIEKAPPPGADQQSLMKRLAMLQQLQEKKEVGRAYTVARDLQSIVGADAGPASELLNKAIERIEAGAERWLDEARDQIAARNLKPACRKLAELSVRLVGSDIKEQADREIGRLQADNRNKRIVRAALANARGELKNDQAADLEAAEQYLEARGAYREVLEQFEGTDAARAAEDAIDRINSDPRIQSRIKALLDAEEAARWYDLAQRYARVELYDLARRQFDKLITEHPDSRAAQKARRRVDTLGDEAKARAKRRAALRAKGASPSRPGASASRRQPARTAEPQPKQVGGKKGATSDKGGKAKKRDKATKPKRKRGRLPGGGG